MEHQPSRDSPEKLPLWWTAFHRYFNRISTAEVRIVFFSKLLPVSNFQPKAAASSAEEMPLIYRLQQQAGVAYLQVSEDMSAGFESCTFPVLLCRGGF